MSVQIEKFIEKVKSKHIKVVSFDIFDTLLLRPTVSPTDLFKLVSKKANFSDEFIHMRVQAEKEARKFRAFNNDDVTLDQIYDSFQSLFDVDTEMLNKLKQTEMDVEYQYLYPRKSVQSIYQAAIQANKTIIITSDMYLPKTFLEKVLHKNGYGQYERFYLSCEEAKAKGTGNLFRKVVEDFARENIAPHEILHIGDNYHADIKQAEKFKLKTAYIPNAMNEFKRRDRLRELIGATHNNVDNSFLIGYAANQIFDDPFVPFTLKSYFNGDQTNFAQIMMAPLLLSFSKWMVEEAIEDQIDTLLFTYRDGYIPEKIYQMLSSYYDVPDREAIYLSRTMRMCYFAKKKNGLFQSIIDLPVNRDMTLIHFIKNRLLVEDQDEINEVLDIFLENGYTSENECIGELPRYTSLLKKLEVYFVKNATEKIKLINEYCQQYVNPDKKIAVFDVGYRGSVSRFIKDHFNQDNTGYHIFATPLIDTNQSHQYQLKSYVKYGQHTTQRTIILHVLIEDIISSQEGSATGIAKVNGELFITRETINKSDEKMAAIQEGILQFTEGFIDLFREDLKLLEFDHYLHFEFLEKFLTSPNKVDAELIQSLQFYDAQIINSQVKNRYVEWHNQFYRQPVNLQPSKRTKRDYYNKIKDTGYIICKRLGILPFAKSVMKPVLKFIEKERINHFSVIQQDIQKSLNMIQQQELLRKKKNILIFGDMVSYDKGTCHYLNTLSKNMPDYNFILVSEATWIPLPNTQQKIHFPILIVPNCFGKNRYPARYKVSLTQEMKNSMKEKDYLRWAADNWKARHSDMGKGYPEFLAYCADEYYSKLLDLLQPESIIMWNQFHALHHIISSVVTNKGIPTMYMEFGSLPGTIALETYGQMGESYPAQYVEQFKNLSLTIEERNDSKKLLTYLKESKLNRNVQVANQSISKLKKKLKPNRPILFYAGQNDFESGMYPYNEHTKKYHSPIFKSTNDGLLYLAKLAEKNDWNLIYKPHPIITMFNSDTIKIPDNVIYIEQADINDLIDLSDLTITILSQVAYISLIREKPVLMLGYTQLKGKDCTYEAFTLNEIESMIHEGIHKGLTKEQHEAFIVHAGQLTKYYLFDDLVHKDMRFGNDVDKAIKLIRDASEDSKKEKNLS